MYDPPLIYNKDYLAQLICTLVAIESDQWVESILQEHMIFTDNEDLAHIHQENPIVSHIACKWFTICFCFKYCTVL